MYTITFNGLTFTGSHIEVARKYVEMKQYVGGDEGYGSMLKVTDRLGEKYDMEGFLAGMARLLAPA